VSHPFAGDSPVRYEVTNKRGGGLACRGEAQRGRSLGRENILEGRWHRLFLEREKGRNDSSGPPRTCEERGNERNNRGWEKRSHI